MKKKKHLYYQHSSPQLHHAWGLVRHKWGTPVVLHGYGHYFVLQCGTFSADVASSCLCSSLPVVIHMLATVFSPLHTVH